MLLYARAVTAECGALTAKFGCWLSALEHLVDGESNIANNFSQECGRNIATSMEWHRRGSTISMAELFVGTALPDFDEAQYFQQSHDFARLENWDGPHAYAT